MQGTIVKGIGGFYYATAADGELYTLRAQAKLRRERLKPMVGDRIEMEPGEGEDYGWVRAILPRRNQLTRPPVANIDVILVVAAAAAPDPDMAMLDRLILNARLAGIEPRLAINKCDLDEASARTIAAQYAHADVQPMAVCARTGQGVAELRESLIGKTHALAGQSGAGKSSLLNALYGFTLETGDISRRIERGKNTTRHCELIPVPGGGMALDTPGFSLLETPLIEPETLKEHYPELLRYEGGCYFQPCMHATEPKCAARDAVACGEISRERHERYVELLEEMRIRWRDRYD
ncbi:MAG: ribosome small subunit-dependent GTPase A [Christensenellales bacterium]